MCDLFQKQFEFWMISIQPDGMHDSCAIDWEILLIFMVCVEQ
jgi:hypothetical protein